MAQISESMSRQALRTPAMAAMPARGGTTTRVMLMSGLGSGLGSGVGGNCELRINGETTIVACVDGC